MKDATKSIIRSITKNQEVERRGNLVSNLKRAMSEGKKTLTEPLIFQGIVMEHQNLTTKIKWNKRERTRKRTGKKREKRS
jgi:hypothetical protein